ncbi:MAG: RNA methyltransferase [Anaerolineae bacterium]
MITSTANDKVKHARSLEHKKQRSAHRQFLVEGVRVIEEATRAGNIPALVFFDPEMVEADERASKLLGQLQTVARQVEAVSSAVFQTLTQTETPQGLVAVYSYPDLPIPRAPALALVLDALRDPGNLGAILRTAWAAGVDLVLLAPGTADPFNPKVVRAAMGAHFFLPLVAQSWPVIAQHLHGIPRIYLADARGETRYSEADWTAPRALIVGGEAEGASAEARELATARLAIPMPGQAESLNAAIAAGILLFQAIAR